MGPARKGFNAILGHRFVEWTDGRVVLELDIDEQHLNSVDFVHGGALMTLVDIAAGSAGTYAATPADHRGCLTISLTANFLSPAKSGPLRIVGLRRGGGRSTFTATAEIFDADNNLCVVGQGVFRLLPHKGGKVAE